MKDFLSYHMMVIQSELSCTECRSKGAVFTNVMLLHKDSTRSPDDGVLIEKDCPKCKGKTFNAAVIQRMMPSTADESSWYPDLTEFTHRLSCANPDCPWTLESIARSIHVPSIPREDLIRDIAQAIQEKFTELRKTEMEWTEKEHPCIRPWDQLSDEDKRLPLLYAETALDMLDQCT